MMIYVVFADNILFYPTYTEIASRYRNEIVSLVFDNNLTEKILS